LRFPSQWVLKREEEEDDDDGDDDGEEEEEREHGCVQEKAEDWKTLLASHNAHPLVLRSHPHAHMLLQQGLYWPLQEKSPVQAPGPPKAIFDDLFPIFSSSLIFRAGSLSDFLIPITLNLYQNQLFLFKECFAFHWW
jgi:hypothetical protein